MLHVHVEPEASTTRLELLRKITKFILAGIYGTKFAESMAWQEIACELISKPSEALVPPTAV
jgi:hypothetical protein